jgi:hypothetical protein
VVNVCDYTKVSNILHLLSFQDALYAMVKVMKFPTQHLD